MVAIIDEAYLVEWVCEQAKYLCMELMFSKMQELNIDISRFQQNGAMFHIAAETINLLKVHHTCMKLFIQRCLR